MASWYRMTHVERDMRIQHAVVKPVSHWVRRVCACVCVCVCGWCVCVYVHVHVKCVNFTVLLQLRSVCFTRGASCVLCPAVCVCMCVGVCVPVCVCGGGVRVCGYMWNKYCVVSVEVRLFHVGRVCASLYSNCWSVKMYFLHKRTSSTSA